VDTGTSGRADEARTTWRTSGGEHLSEGEREGWTAFWEQLLNARIVASFVLCGLLAALPMLGPDRVALACVALVAGVSVNVALLARVRRGHPVRAHVAICDMVTVLAVLALAPAVYSAGVILIVSSSALFTFWFGGRFTPYLQVPVGLALLGIGLWRQPELWFPTWIAWFVCATLGTAAIVRIAAVSAQARTRYDDMVNGLDAMVWEGPGPSGDADYVSGRVVELLGFGPEDVARFSFLASHVHPDDLDEVIQSRRRLAAGQDIEVHYRIRDAWARQRHLHERVRVELDHDGEVTRRRGIVVDETARWEAESSVRSYVDFIEGIPIALAILRLDDPEDASSLRVVVGNPAAADLVGRPVDEAVGRRLCELLPASTPMLDRLADVARLGVALERPSLALADDGAIHALRAMPLADQCIGLALEDVTKRARLAESLRHQALHDHLTGLPNRAQLNQRLAQALDRAAGDGSRTGLLLMDLNQFKDVNDSLGHEYGDRLLIELARRLSRGMRNCDTIARLGGDEFAVLLTDVRDEHAALGVADRLVELCVEPFTVGEFRLQVGASVGIALAPDHASGAADLLRCADSAMYRAKEAGGGIVAHSDARDATSVTKIDLLAELTEAVDSDEMVVHYQPRLELGSLRPVGVEALVRWRHPERGLLPPAAFLELAEVSGTIQMLTRVVTRRATTELPALDLPDGFAISVNLSSRNLSDPQLELWVRDLLSTAAIPPTSLCFEMTERQLMDDPGQTLEVLHRLRHLGVRLAIDDFGTGYSSMPYLRELPVDEVKIDRRFVADLEAGDDTIARSVIDLGHNLGLHVVAEGVESADALRRLTELGCDSAQGYHLGMPMPVAELATYLAERRGSWV
jgi:diguanylate cyclase (GGDEF)-like protein